MTTIEQRFSTKIAESGDCWQWLGAVKDNGYGQFWNGTKQVKAHRWAYEHFTGPIQEGHEIDHLCRNRSCVNPEHLEAVTHSENIKRGLTPTLSRERAAQVTHCPQGHEYTPENTYRVFNTKRGYWYRHCRECRKH